MDFRLEFIEFVLANDILRFGEFKIKSGRLSPYFFNAGLFNDGLLLDRLSQFYAKAILDSGISIDMLFGPAYKGIPLVSGCAMALARAGRNLPFAFNRKEAKDHGEGGLLIGAPLSGNVLIVDDVISAGTSVRESVALIRAAGAAPCGVAVALDRMERGSGALSAVQEAQMEFGIPVIAIATLDNLITYLRDQPDFSVHETRILRYRQEYGIENIH
ncbi:MAG: orotate phosphoribosyltransferase [Candidatus Accumulibacter sp.]|jgi:orotate phosphoribosyltransferase|nr:orotate phosphoribosyltransferase [Accumulibacter sp.]